MRFMCPVTWFLSLAFADGVFEDLHSYNDLESAKPLPGDRDYTAKYKPEALKRPIMRAMCENHSISDTKIWKYRAFNDAIKGLGQRAGYRDTLTAYCFRRGFATTI